MENIFDKKFIHRAIKKLDAAKPAVIQRPLVRQPAHTFYGGAHLFKADTCLKMGKIGTNGLEKYCGGGDQLNKIFIHENPMAPRLNITSEKLPDLGGMVYERLSQKLTEEPIEDYRLDFEDGFGIRSDAEEDAEAFRTADEAAAAFRKKTLPRLFGIRLKPFNSVFLPRALRTLEIFITRLHKSANGKIPEGLIITIPKIENAEEVELLNKSLHLLEEKFSLPANYFRSDLMIETPAAVIFERKINIEKIIDSAGERCIAVNIGIYDYTSLLGIASQSQTYTHSSIDFLRNMLKIISVQKNVNLVDGATHILPVEIYKISAHKLSVSEEEESANISAIYSAWKLAFNNNLHSLNNGIYQGWDLHPYQLIPRYASLYYYFLAGLESSLVRMKNFLSSANNQTMTDHYFDDAASASGLYNYFVKAVSCGALTENDLAPLGKSRKDFLTKSLRELIG